MNFILVFTVISVIVLIFVTFMNWACYYGFNFTSMSCEPEVKFDNSVEQHIFKNDSSYTPEQRKEVVDIYRDIEIQYSITELTLFDDLNSRVLQLMSDINSIRNEMDSLVQDEDVEDEMYTDTMLNQQLEDKKEELNEVYRRIYRRAEEMVVEDESMKKLI